MRPARRPMERHTPVQEITDDYLIDGIEKHVPLLPATMDTEIDDITPSETPESSLHREHLGSDEYPTIPPRPARVPRAASEELEVPVIPKRPLKRTSLDHSEEVVQTPLQMSPDEYLPQIPPRPARRASVRSDKSQEEEEENLRQRRISVQSIPETPEVDDEPELEPTIPPRPTRKASIKSISSELVENQPEEAEPVIPPRPTRKSSVKSTPEVIAEPVRTELEPIIPSRPTATRKSSTKISEVSSPELPPSIPQRPTRKSSVRSFKSQYSIEEEPELEQFNVSQRPLSIVSSTLEPTEPNLPPLSTSEVLKAGEYKLGEESKESVESKELPHPIEDVPNLQHQHHEIPVGPRGEEPIEVTAATVGQIPAIPPRPQKKKAEESPTDTSVVHETPSSSAHPEEKSDDSTTKNTKETEVASNRQKEPEAAQDKSKEEPGIPPIPARPQKKSEESAQKAGTAVLASQIPVVPPRPTKHKSPSSKVATDPTPETIRPQAGTIAESVEGRLNRNVDSSHHDRNDKPLAPRTSEIQTAALEAQNEVIPKPPIPARPQHKLAKQFEATMLKEKPAPPPRPAKPAVASKFAGLRAQFAKDLNARLAKPPPVPTKKEEEVHAVELEKTEEAKDVIADSKDGGEKVVDMRKGRARGPQRRPPTVKPIVPTGWGLSEISTVFEQRLPPEIQAEEPAETFEKLETQAQTETQDAGTEEEIADVDSEEGSGEQGAEHVVPEETPKADAREELESVAMVPTSVKPVEPDLPTTALRSTDIVGALEAAREGQFDAEEAAEQ